MVELLSRFRIERILDEDCREKRITLLGKTSTRDGEIMSDAIVELERLAIDRGLLFEAFSSDVFKHQDVVACFDATDMCRQHVSISNMVVKHQNDRWYSFWCALQVGHVDAKISIVYPATLKDICKKTKERHVFVSETPFMYEKYVVGYIENHPLSFRQWILNILDGNSEQESILYSDPDPHVGLCILPDLKWDRINMHSMHLLCMFRDTNLRCLRDLSLPEHLSLMKKARRDIEMVCSSRFHIPYNELRLFFHYQPTYYLLHIHVCHVSFEASGMFIGRAHLLDDVIDNMENICIDYYKRKTLHYTVAINSDLHEILGPGLEM